MISVYATKRCGHCGKGGVLSIKEEQLFKWLSGTPIQEAFPELSIPLREQIISGIHPECWEKMFAYSEED
jgi:hypothetical protein